MNNLTRAEQYSTRWTMLHFRILITGDLQITISKYSQFLLTDEILQWKWIGNLGLVGIESRPFEREKPNLGFYQVWPQDIGALTDGFICCLYSPDNCLWWDECYQIESWVTRLLRDGEVILQRVRD